MLCFNRIQIELYIGELSLQDYGCDFAEMAKFWRQYNWMLMHIMRAIPATALENLWQRPDGEKSLRVLMEGYFEHIQMHTDHYRERMQLIGDRS